MKKRTVVLVALAMFFVASAIVFAYDFCFFADGVSVSFTNPSDRAASFVKFNNESDEGRSVPHIVHFEDGSKVGPKNTYVPAKSTKSDEYSKKIKNVEQCW